MEDLFPCHFCYDPDYLKSLVHSSAVCDRCMTCIQGEWFRCAYCAKDLCDVCEEVDTHNDSHVFLVFKSIVCGNVIDNIRFLIFTTLPLGRYASFQVSGVYVSVNIFSLFLSSQAFRRSGEPKWKSTCYSISRLPLV